MRRQPFILLSFSSSKKARKAPKGSPQNSHTARSITDYKRCHFHSHSSISVLLWTFSHKRRTFAFTSESGYVPHHRQQNRTQRLTRRNTGHFRWGRYYYPRSVLHGSETLRGRVSERRTLAILGLGRGYSRRTQRAFGTAMRLCASLFRGVAAPLGCVICLQLGDVAVFSLCAQYFLNVRGGGGITTLGAFHTVRKPCVAVA